MKTYGRRAINEISQQAVDCYMRHLGGAKPSGRDEERVFCLWGSNEVLLHYVADRVLVLLNKMNLEGITVVAVKSNPFDRREFEGNSAYLVSIDSFQRTSSRGSKNRQFSCQELAGVLLL